MKAFMTGLLCYLIFITQAQTTISATTSDGKMVTLSPDGTWYYSTMDQPANGTQTETRVAMVQNQLSNKISKESQGALTLVSFTKTNGMEQSAFGVQAYIVEFTALIRAQQFCIKPGDSFSGWFKDFYVVLQEPTDGWDRNNLYNAKRLQSGAKITITGKATLVKKDNGWEVGRIEIQNGVF